MNRDAARSEGEDRLIIEREDLVIDHDDLVDDESDRIDLTTASWDDVEETTSQGVYYPPLSSESLGEPAGSKGAFQKVAEALNLSLVQTVAVGAIAGFLAWAFTELLVRDDNNGSTLGQVMLAMGLFFSIVGAFIGAGLAAGERLYARNYRRAAFAALYGAGAGLIGGFVGGMFGQLIYSLLDGGSSSPSFGAQLFARTLGWSGLGLAVGIGGGIASGLSGDGAKRWWPLPPASKAKSLNGLIGGAIGGAAGGFLFDLVGGPGGGLSRAIAMTLVGAATGGGVGFVANLRKEAWLSVVGGPMAGKQFILYEGTTTVGASAKCDIVLMPHRDIAPVHAAIGWEAGRATLWDEGSAQGTFVNGRRVERSALRPDAEIRIGDTVMRFSTQSIR